MAFLDFISGIHQSTQRNYLARVNDVDKAKAAEIAKRFDRDYFDGERIYGYGGYRYDGRWASLAKKLVEHYQLKSDAKILDIGCAKGFLVYELSQILPKGTIQGIDCSSYAIENGMNEVKGSLQGGLATSLPFTENYFDLVISINTLHNLRLPELEKALQEIERVGKNHKFIVMDGYRNEQEKVNLLYWQLTCECFFTPLEWEWIFQKTGYSGDYDLVYFQ